MEHYGWKEPALSDTVLVGESLEQLQIIADINKMEMAIAGPEQTASEVRWEQSKKVVEALDSGLTQQQVADQWLKPDGTPYSQPHVARTKSAHTKYYYSNNRPSWYEAWNGAGAHAQYNSGENEWYTPAEYIAAARDVMGGIDLDPASSALANETVLATRFYAKDDDGLAQRWEGRVWMNPPYSKDLIYPFCDKLAEEYANEHVTQAVVLVNNGNDTAWYARIAELASGLCQPNHRVKFLSPDGKPSAPVQGQLIVYLGDNPEGFAARFLEFGHTWIKP